MQANPHPPLIEINCDISGKIKLVVMWSGLPEATEDCLADRVRPRRYRCRGEGRPRDVPAHPELYAELDYQEDSAGALPGAA
jgi:hypothetical protein